MAFENGTKRVPHQILSAVGVGGMGEVYIAVANGRRLLGLSYVEAFPHLWSRSFR